MLQKCQKKNWDSLKTVIDVSDIIVIDENSKKDNQYLIEKDYWSIFGKIVNIVEDNDVVYFDITHSFRIMPIIATLVINYIRVLKNAEVKAMYYGVFDNDIYNRDNNVLFPILNAAEMIDLIDFSNGLNEFITTGQAKLLKNITKNSDSKYDKLIESMENIGFMMASCRTNEIPKAVSELKKIINNLKSDNSVINLYNPMLKKVEEKYSKFNDKTNNIYSIIMWCIENGLVQQALTILVEYYKYNISTYLNFTGDEKQLYYTVSNTLKANRNNLLGSAIIKHKDKNSLEYKIYILDETMNKQGIDLKGLNNIFNELRRLRNDINHAGILNKYDACNYRPESLVNKIKFFKKFFRIMENLNEDKIQNQHTKISSIG